MTDLESAAAEIVRELVNACLAEDGYGGFSEEDWRGLGVRHYDEAIARIVALAQDYHSAGEREQFDAAWRSPTFAEVYRAAMEAHRRLTPKIEAPPVRREHSPL